MVNLGDELCWLQVIVKAEHESDEWSPVRMPVPQSSKPAVQSTDTDYINYNLHNSLHMRSMYPQNDCNISKLSLLVKVSLIFILLYYECCLFKKCNQLIFSR